MASAGINLIKVALLAALAASLLCGSARADGLLRQRRLGRTPLWNPAGAGFQKVPGKGLCSAQSIWTALPSYDWFKLAKDIVDGRDGCSRVCNAVQCSAFNYAPVGWAWWYYRDQQVCHVYHDYGSQLPGTGGHIKGAKAFDFVASQTTWFWRDWSWMTGECYVAKWRHNLVAHGGHRRDLGIFSWINKAFRFITGRGSHTDLQNGARENNVQLAHRVERNRHINQAPPPRVTGLPDVDRFVALSESIGRAKMMHISLFSKPLTFFDFVQSTFQKAIGTQITQNEVDAYCAYLELAKYKATAPSHENWKTQHGQTAFNLLTSGDITEAELEDFGKKALQACATFVAVGDVFDPDRMHPGDVFGEWSTVTADYEDGLADGFGETKETKDSGLTDPRYRVHTTAAEG